MDSQGKKAGKSSWKEEIARQIGGEIKGLVGGWTEEGQIIRINNIYFRANQSILLPESFSELDRVVDFLKDNPNIYVEIGGHTNGLPSHEFCDQLSEARAKRVYQYFIDKGIPAGHLSYKGYGKRQPIADNNTLSGRKKNQRVELKIIRVD